MNKVLASGYRILAEPPGPEMSDEDVTIDDMLNDTVRKTDLWRE